MKVYKIKLNNKVYEVEVEVSSNNASIQMPATQATPAAPAQAAPASPAPAAAPANVEGGQKVEVPMPGTILDIRVQVGQKINKGDVIAILEAMKMENEILASNSGIVKEIFVSEKQKVESQESLMIIE